MTFAETPTFEQMYARAYPAGLVEHDVERVECPAGLAVASWACVERWVDANGGGRTGGPCKGCAKGAQRRKALADDALDGKTLSDKAEGPSLEWSCRWGRKRLSPDVIRQAKSDLDAGFTLIQVAAKSGFTRKAIAEGLARAGLVSSRRNTIPPKMLDEMIERYYAGWSLRQISDSYGFSAGSLSIAFRKANVRMRSVSEAVATRRDYDKRKAKA